MEDTPIGLDKWLSAIWLIVNAKNGISSYEIHRALGVTQKTAWFMLHRIRFAMQDGSFDKMSGRLRRTKPSSVASARFMHKTRTKPGRDWQVGKVAVMGLLERDPEKEHRACAQGCWKPCAGQDVDLWCASMLRRARK